MCVCVKESKCRYNTKIKLMCNITKQQEESLGHIQQRQISQKMAIDVQYCLWVEEENIQKTTLTLSSCTSYSCKDKFHSFEFDVSNSVFLCVCVCDEMSVSLCLCKSSGLLQDGAP